VTKHTFNSLLGGVTETDRFMQGPPLAPGMAWVEYRPNHWVEQTSPHGPESDPNHPSYDLHIFGHHYKPFMERQHKR
jgi:hypothetical protein